MKNKILIIGIPLLVLIGLVAIIVATQKPIEKLSDELRIVPFDFKVYVEKYISDSIVGQSRAAAQKRYDHIYEIIATESSIYSTTNNTRNQLIDPKEADAYYAKSFEAYFAIFGSEADRLFSAPKWGIEELKFIKSESQRLLNLNGNNRAIDSLKHCIQYVDGYSNAIKLIKRSKNCTDARSYNSYYKQAKMYQCHPYENNDELRDIVSRVSDNARNEWRNSIEKYVEEVCKRPVDSYSSYDQFYDGPCSDAHEKIREYNSTFNSSWGSDLTSKLESCDTAVKNYFTSREELLPSYE